MQLILFIFLASFPLVFGGVTRCVHDGTGALKREEICGGKYISERDCLNLGCCYQGGICFYGGQKLGYANAGRAGETNFADASFQTWQHESNHGDIFYGKSEQKGSLGILPDTPFDARAEVGFINHKSGINNFQISHKIGVAGGEAFVGGLKGFGVMGRASAIEGTLHTGPVDVNYGIKVDTGFKVDRGIEAKIAGIGGKIRADGIEACFIICFGINW